MSKPRRLIPPEVRLYSKITEGPVSPLLGTPCHIWRNRTWYGEIEVNGVRKPVHRYAYELVHGPVPSELVIDHLCRVPACVRVDHLEAVTESVNTRRGISPAAIHARKTHCPKDHPYDHANTVIDSGGARRCRICLKARKAAWWQRYVAKRAVV